MKKITLICFVLPLLTFISCSEKIDTEADMEAIRNLSEKLFKALEVGDVNTMKSIFSINLVELPPNAPIIQDMEKSLSRQEKNAGKFIIDYDFTFKEVSINGDWAFVRWGTKSKTTPSIGGETVEGSYKGIWIWQKEADGSWKLARSIWNSDLTVEQNQ